MIDFARIEQKLDELFARHDLASADRLLAYWLDDAVATQDRRGEIQIRNEQLGLFRRQNDKERAFATAEALLPLLDDGVWEGTVLLNIATDYCHFARPDLAMPLYARIETAYGTLPEEDIRWAWYYNNRAASDYACRRYGDALAAYCKALDVLRRLPPSLETGMTYVNAAMCRYMMDPLSPLVDEDMQNGYRALMGDFPLDGHYAFAIEKVLPAYRHLGYRQEVEGLEERKKQCEANY